MQPGEWEMLESLRQRLAEARRESDAAKEAVAEAQRRAAYWDTRATGLAKAVAGLEEAEPADPLEGREPEIVEPEPVVEPATAQSGDTPRGQEAVQRILKEQSDTWLTVREVARIAHERGWVDGSQKSVEAIRIALKRATRAGDLERGSVDGRTFAYRLRRQDPPSTNGTRPSEEVVHEEGLEVGR